MTKIRREDVRKILPSSKKPALDISSNHKSPKIQIQTYALAAFYAV